uniref:Sugar phosphate transporter domain-containing protein n=1 Tax=Parascaris univalens TaxID=6257 RepID=A0A914ZSI3_PARUN
GNVRNAMRHKLQDDDERLLARERDGTVRPTSMSKILLMVMLYYPLSIGLTFYQKWFIKVRFSIDLCCLNDGVQYKGIFGCVGPTFTP